MWSKLMNTEYGGRITLKLPGGTEMKVHFKDKEKVMRKKRWSQVNLSCLLFFFFRKRKEFTKIQYNNTRCVCQRYMYSWIRNALI